MEIAKIKQRLEILWNEVEKLEASGGGSGGDSYTKAETNTLLSAKADKSTTYTKTETNAEIQGAINDLDVSSTSATGHYIKSIGQADGKIEAVAELLDTEPITGSTKPITSGAVYTALQNLPTGGTDLTPISITIPSNRLIPEEYRYVIDKHLPFNNMFCVGDQGGNLFYMNVRFLNENKPYRPYFWGTIVNKNTYYTTPISSQGSFVPITTRYSAASDAYQDNQTENISSTANLNSYNNAGIYRGTNSGSMTNCPITGGFLLIVDLRYQETQEIHPLDHPEIIYRRAYFSGSWTSWYKFEGTVVS